MELFKNKIDRMVNKKAKLELRKQKIEDKKNEINSAIETKLKKLDNLAWRNKQNATNQIAEIEREIKKLKQLIKVEKEYVAKINEGQN